MFNLILAIAIFILQHKFCIEDKQQLLKRSLFFEENDCNRILRKVEDQNKANLKKAEEMRFSAQTKRNEKAD